MRPHRFDLIVSGLMELKNPPPWRVFAAFMPQDRLKIQHAASREFAPSAAPAAL
jgi:hypothetical protein